MAIFDAIERRDRAILERTLDTVEDALEAVETPLDAAPARCDQLDEKGKVLDASCPLCVEIALQALQAPDRLS